VAEVVAENRSIETPFKQLKDDVYAVHSSTVISYMDDDLPQRKLEATECLHTVHQTYFSLQPDVYWNKAGGSVTSSAKCININMAKQSCDRSFT